MKLRTKKDMRRFQRKLARQRSRPISDAMLELLIGPYVALSGAEFEAFYEARYEGFYETFYVEPRLMGILSE